MAQGTGSGDAGEGGNELMGLFRLIFSVGADATGFRVGMKQVESVAQRATSRIAGYMAGAFSVGAVVSMTKRTIDFASSMKDMADRAGVATDEIQEFNYAAKLTGTSIETVVTAMKKLSQSRASALGGNDKAMSAFAALGISRGQLEMQSIPETLYQIGDAVKAMGPTSDRGAIITALLGRGGDAMIPMFNEGMRGLGEEARRTGAVMQKALITDLEKAGDEIDKLTMKWTVFFGQVLGGIRLLMQDLRGESGLEGKIADKARIDYGKAKLKQQISIANRIQKEAGTQGGKGWMSFDAAMNLALDEMDKASKPTGLSFTTAAAAPRFQTVSRNQDFGSLASVGGFFGLGGTKDATVSYLKRIEDNTKKTADNTDPNKEGDDL